MAKAKPSDLAMSRDAAQKFTSVVAVLFGVVWVAKVIFNIQISWLDTVSKTLLLATAVGGIVMGLLYLTYLLNKK